MSYRVISFSRTLEEKNPSIVIYDIIIDVLNSKLRYLIIFSLLRIVRLTNRILIYALFDVILNSYFKYSILILFNLNFSNFKFNFKPLI